MFKLATLTALLAALAASAQTFSIATPPSLVQCQPVQLSWTAGNSPFILAAIPGGQTGAAAIETIDAAATTSPFTWTVNLMSGTSITVKITDAQGNIQYTSPLTIQAGASSACLNATAMTSGVSTSAVTTTVSGSTTVAGGAVASSVSGSTTSLSSSASSSATSAASSASTSASSTAAATSAASAASSVASAVSSAAVSATSKSGAMATDAAGLPALAAVALGGVALLF